MKILHVYKDYYPVIGGIENYVRMLAEVQAAAGHQVTVLVTNPGGEPARVRLQGVEVIRAGRLAMVASTPLSLSLPLWLRRQSPDITHLQFPYPLAEISQLLAGRARPFVISYQSDVVKQQRILRLYQPLLRRVLTKANRIIASSPNYVTSSPYLRPLAHKCTVVPLAIDPAPFLAAEPLLPPAALPTLLFVGRHRYYKGVDDLLQAMTAIPAQLLIAGDGPMRPAWETLARQLDLAERVHFLGDVNPGDLPGLYASADVFVLPSNVRAEAFGIVLLEAMAAGRPCVTTELATGTSYVVQDGVTGFVVRPRRPNELARAINRLLADAELRQAMGQAGRERLLREFTIEEMAARIEAVYQEALRFADS